MIIDELKRLKNGSYSISCNNESYVFDEDVIVEYRLVKGKEITEEILAAAAKKNDLMEYYHKALNYSLRYGKNSNATYDFLIKNGLSDNQADKIISMLSSNKIIDDSILLEGQIAGLVRRKYGILYIKEKLRERKFPLELINQFIGKIDWELYYSNMNSLYLEALKRYNGEPFIVKAKAKKYLASRGFSYDDLNHLD